MYVFQKKTEKNKTKYKHAKNQKNKKNKTTHTSNSEEKILLLSWCIIRHF